VVEIMVDSAPVPRQGRIRAGALALFTALGAALGVGAKTLTDNYFEYRRTVAEKVTERSLEFEEKQLSEFWWPVYYHFQVDNQAWMPIFTTRASDTRYLLLRDALIDQVIIPNHNALVNLLKTKFQFAIPALQDKETMKKFPELEK
jgi:hypothetical protein